jgi:hypothetical protein
MRGIENEIQFHFQLNRLSKVGALPKGQYHSDDISSGYPGQISGAL